MMPSDETMHGPAHDAADAETLIGRALRHSDEYNHFFYVVGPTLIAASVVGALAFIGFDRSEARAFGVEPPSATSYLWPHACVVALFIFIAGGMWLLTRLAWVRVRENGLQVRHFRGWDFWPWERFASGEVMQGRTTDSYLDPAQPHRRCCFAPTAYEEGDRLASLCRQHYVAAPLIIPEGIEIRAKRMHAHFDHQGMDITAGDEEHRHSWAEVSSVRLFRGCREHRSFYKLTMDVGGHTFKFDKSDRPVFGPPWKGPDDHIIEAFLRHFVPEGKITEAALFGPATTIHDFDERLDNARSEYRGRSKLLAFSVVFALVLGLMAFSLLKRDISYLVYSMLFAGEFGGIFFVLWRIGRNIERQREAFLRQEAAKTGEDTHALEE